VTGYNDFDLDQGLVTKPSFSVKIEQSYVGIGQQRDIRI